VGFETVLFHTFEVYLVVIFVTYMDLHLLLEGKNFYMPLAKGLFGMAPIADSSFGFCGRIKRSVENGFSSSGFRGARAVLF